MLSVLSRNAQEQGPIEGGGSLLQQAAAAQAPAGRGSMLIYLSPRMHPNQSNARCPRSAATNLALAVVGKSSKNVVAVQLEQ